MQAAVSLAGDRLSRTDARSGCDPRRGVSSPATRVRTHASSRATPVAERADDPDRDRHHPTALWAAAHAAGLAVGATPVAASQAVKEAVADWRFAPAAVTPSPAREVRRRSWPGERGPAESARNVSCASPAAPRVALYRSRGRVAIRVAAGIFSLMTHAARLPAGRASGIGAGSETWPRG